MKAIVVQTDQSLRWIDVPDPQIGPKEALLRVQATAVNRADLLQRRGLYPPPSGAPEWMGLEAAGTLMRVGHAVEGWREGAAACALLAGGGYAERVAVDASLLLPIPRGLDAVSAAALPEVFTTAYLNLRLEAGLRAGESVLIYAGASGVGTAAIQLARCWGCRVAATVGTEEKAAKVRNLGADLVINHRKEDVTASLSALAESPSFRGLDVVLDCLGGEDLSRHLPLLNPGGRWVVIGLMRGPSAEIDLRQLLTRRLRLIGSTLRARPVTEKARILAGLREDVWPLLESGKIAPVIHAVLPITRAEEAHRLLRDNENIGKVILRVD